MKRIGRWLFRLLMVGVEPPPSPRDRPPLTPEQAAERKEQFDAAMRKQAGSLRGV